jgi:hypothetical protein
MKVLVRAVRIVHAARANRARVSKPDFIASMIQFVDHRLKGNQPHHAEAVGRNKAGLRLAEHSPDVRNDDRDKDTV